MAEQQKTEAERPARMATEAQQSAENQSAAAREAEKRTSQVASHGNASFAQYLLDAGKDVLALTHLAQALRLNPKNERAGALTGPMLTQTCQMMIMPQLVVRDSSAVVP